MEYIKTIFLLLFVLGIVASVSSRHAAKHYPLEDAGNQEESSLVKKTLKGQGSSLTSAFDFGEEKNKPKVSSVRNIDSNSVQFIVHNPANGVEWEALKPDFIYRGKRAMELPTKVPPGHLLRYHTQPEDAGLAAGVFTYFIPEMAFTLAVMYTVEFSLFDNLAQSYWYNVKIYSDRKHANKDLFYDISHDSVQADGKIHHMELGFDFTAEVEASGTFSHTPTLTVRNMNINKLLRKNLNTE